MGSLLTVVGCGMLRDLLAQRIPVILQKDIYALSGLVGALLLWLLMKSGVGSLPSMAVSLCLVIGIRMMSAVYQIRWTDGRRGGFFRILSARFTIAEEIMASGSCLR
jgi:uncharacterized membrane protein YeiH